MVDKQAKRGQGRINPLMGIPLTHVKFYWTVFAKTHHAAPPQDLNASPAKWLFAALEARPVFRITGATCVKGIPINPF
ncbi:MAG: hypothetical protein COZ23_00905 [Hydrogenophilales bacterium CG_4_10_14_3_um_filter_58_23]|nr:MAG: hypothetical protein COZ23_00905 [Hydrogenophilales bacterium CG_4_10_14_3_um_filter_58_23]